MTAHVLVNKRSAPVVRLRVQKPVVPAASQATQQARVRRILRGAGAQTKLGVGAPIDVHEQEAGRVADAVMQMPQPRQEAQERPGNPLVQRQCTDCEEELQAKATSRGPPPVATDVESRVSALSKGGQPLPGSERSFMEPRFGLDLSRVRVHTGEPAADLASSLNARAFSLGQSVFFAAGQYAPGTAQGRRLLAHELTHVAQQTGGAPVRKATGAASQQSDSATRSTPQGVIASPAVAQPMIQRHLAVRPPRRAPTARTLTAAQMNRALAYNRRFIGSIVISSATARLIRSLLGFSVNPIPDSTAVIRMIRDVLGISPTPSAVDRDFVNGVLEWQAMHRLRQDGRLGPRTARRLFRELGAEKEARGRVKSGPRYRPQVPAVRTVGGRKRTWFRFDAEFDSDPANGIYPSCCEVRQFIRWNAAAAASWGGPIVPHGGFPAGHGVNRWIEDRASDGTRYGHRTGRFSAPMSEDQYLDSTNRRNQAFGHVYRGIDPPSGPASDAGQYRFLVKVIDVCRRGRTIGRQDVIRVNW